MQRASFGKITAPGVAGGPEIKVHLQAEDADGVLARASMEQGLRMSEAQKHFLVDVMLEIFTALKNKYTERSSRICVAGKARGERSLRRREERLGGAGEGLRRGHRTSTLVAGKRV